MVVYYAYPTPTAAYWRPPEGTSVNHRGSCTRAVNTDRYYLVLYSTRAWRGRLARDNAMDSAVFGAALPASEKRNPAFFRGAALLACARTTWSYRDDAMRHRDDSRQRDGVTRCMPSILFGYWGTPALSPCRQGRCPTLSAWRGWPVCTSRSQRSWRLLVARTPVRPPARPPGMKNQTQAQSSTATQHNRAQQNTTRHNINTARQTREGGDEEKTDWSSASETVSLLLERKLVSSPPGRTVLVEATHISDETRKPKRYILVPGIRLRTAGHGVYGDKFGIRMSNQYRHHLLITSVPLWTKI